MRTLRVRQVATKLGVSVQTIWRWRHTNPGFPQSFKLTPGTTVWSEQEIDDWLNNLTRREATRMKLPEEELDN